MLDAVLLIIGSLVLATSSNWLIENALVLGKALRLSPTTVGLTIVALGTSAPELSINVLASLQGLHQLPFGNIVGSNLTNLLLVLGIAALLRTIRVNPQVVRLGVPLNLIAVVLVAVLIQVPIFWSGDGQGLSRIEGLLLLCTFPLYAYYAVSLGKDHRPLLQIKVSKRKIALATAGVIASLVGLAVGAEWIIQGASNLARTFGISEYVIGLTVVAFGTSLPELATTITGMAKRHPGLVVGNVVGSNLFNLLFILGISVTIRPLPVQASQLTDLYLLAGGFVLLWVLLATSRHKELRRWHGVVLVTLYAAFIASRFFIQT